MKVNYLFLSLFIFVQSCQSIKIKENKEPSTRVQKRVGAIKEIRLTTISNPPSSTDRSYKDGSLTKFWYKKGRIIKQEDQHKDQYTDCTIFEYDGKLFTKSITTSSAVGREFIVERKYDTKHNEIEYISYWNNLLDAKWTMKYDSKGNVIEKEYFDRSGKLFRLEKFDIDYKKRKVTVYEINKEGKVSDHISTFEFDKRGNRTKSEFIDTAKKYKSCTNYEYDKKGNILGYNSCNPDDKKHGSFVYNYIFDSVGNIIKREEIINNVLVKTTTTDIVYW
jgi:hypothetical protein